MIHHETIAPTREAGVVYTSPWMVDLVLDLVLDLAGYLPERRLAELVAFERFTATMTR